MARRNGGEPFPSYGPKHRLVLLLQSLYDASGLKQKEIAAKADVSESHLSAVRSGKGNASPDTVYRIVRAMGASETTARSAKRLAALASEQKPGTPPEADALQSVVTALVRAWHELAPVAAVRAQDPDSAVRQALEVAVARAITQYATSDGRLDVAGPLLTMPCLLASPDVAAEFAKVLAGRGTPDPEPIGHRWQAALTDPTPFRDLAVEAAALLEFFQAEATGPELGPWLRGEMAAGGALLAETRAAARRELAEVTGLAGRRPAELFQTVSVPRILSLPLIWIFVFARSHAGGGSAGRFAMELSPGRRRRVPGCCVPAAVRGLGAGAAPGAGCG